MISRLSDIGSNLAGASLIILIPSINFCLLAVYMMENVSFIMIKIVVCKTATS